MTELRFAGGTERAQPADAAIADDLTHIAFRNVNISAQHPDHTDRVFSPTTWDRSPGGNAWKHPQPRPVFVFFTAARR